MFICIFSSFFFFQFNISETEFTTKYREYLELVEHRRQKDALLLSQVKASSSNNSK